MSDSGPQPGSRDPACEFTQEVRFAVVLYGGVSLAIYMNGVAQELLHLVRATAPAAPDGTSCLLPTVKGSERVYRKLGQLLGGGPGTVDQLRSQDPVKTRFVVDVLSGTSAGGINGVYLAKALANGQREPGFDGLQRLWLNDGDIDRLINDRKSVNDVEGLTLAAPPQSLLNSQRMYRKLLEALEGMEPQGQVPPKTPRYDSPYVDELDLFVTATDIRGVQIPMVLADGAAWERRHRKVFHFRYLGKAATGAVGTAEGTARNDFTSANNPLLAFASRCTSAFPFAFEPMQLNDVAKDAHYQVRPEYAPHDDLTRWRSFFREYDEGFETRAFSDGGCLDNAPFSYATGMLSRRTAPRPVERKLIYIEPVPELRHLEVSHDSKDKPDFAKNVYAALFALPLYQTIREDIQRVVDRNRLIERANTTLSGVEEDVAAAYARRTRPEPLTGDEWARQDLNEMIGVKGIGYGGYHRLKVAAVTDDLAELVAYVAGFDIDTDEFLAIRRLISAWRDMQYVRHHAGPQDTRPTENRFLLDFDLGYRMRRLNFLQTKISEILKFDEHAKEILRCADVPEWPADRQPFEAELRAIFRSINDAFIQLRDAARNLRTTAALSAAIRNLHISGADLRELLSQPTDEQRRALVESRQDEIQAVASTIAATLRGTFDATADNVATAIQPQAALDVRSPSSVARRCLWHYFRYFDDYDMVQFPTLYGTDVGEADPVQVFRISSHDARCLVDEEAVGCRKLAGTVLGHFGAFLDPLWRQNDLLWGRLDGAERLIMAVWPSDRPSDDRTRLIGEAQAAIVAETLASLGKTQRDRLLAETFMRTNSGKPLDGGALSAFVERLKTFADPSDREILNGIDVPKLIDVYASAFEDDRRPPPQPALEAAARGTTVVGRMLDGLADRYQVRQKGLPRLLVTSGLVLWGLVAVAVPQSLPNLVARHWLGVLLLVGIVMSVIGGLFASAPGVQLHLPMWGWGVLLAGLSVALNLAIRWIGKKLRRGAADHTAPPPKRAP